jgi:hypothetical protein
MCSGATDTIWQGGQPPWKTRVWQSMTGNAGGCGASCWRQPADSPTATDERAQRISVSARSVPPAASTCSCSSGGSMGTSRPASAGPSPKRSASMANCSAKPRCCVASTCATAWLCSLFQSCQLVCRSWHMTVAPWGVKCHTAGRTQCASVWAEWATCAASACCSWPLAVGGSAEAAVLGSVPAATCTATADSCSATANDNQQCMDAKVAASRKRCA